MWDIIRTKPNGTHLGKAVPVFIKNGEYYLSKISAFDDGAIDVWGFLDLQLFDKKLTKGWVSTTPPDGSLISVFGLGMAKVLKGEWIASVSDIREQVWDIVRGFDPTLSNAIDMEGSASIGKNKMRVAKLGLPDDKPVRKSASSEPILGGDIPVFVPDGQDYRLERWFIFSDGLVRIGADGSLVPFDDIEEQLKSGKLTTRAQGAKWILIPGLGQFQAHNANWFVKPEQRVLEGRDILDRLRGEDGAVRTCIRAHQRYEAQPTNANREALRDAYERVPEHLRLFCGDIDTKDRPIRRILYPDATD